ncbi:MAG: diguanylate cyclase [Meiothermus sp.]|nr:diguanylate cyclase [Meiothermus sp.]
MGKAAVTATLLGRTDFLDRLNAWGEQGPITVALIDLDRFKAVNDTYGHAIGDLMIERVLKTLQGSLSGEVSIARLGGDEFAAAFPASSPEEALIQLEEIRQYLCKPHPLTESVALPAYICAGIASFPQHAADARKALDAADEALWRAKREGRNKIAIYVEEKMTLKSNYYPKSQLERLSKLSEGLGRTEASLLREGLADLIEKYRDAQ